MTDSKLSHDLRYQEEQDRVLLQTRLEMAQSWIQSADGWLRQALDSAREANIRADDALTWAHRSAIRLHQEKQTSTDCLRRQMAAEQRNAELTAYVHALTHSFSWRISLPIRVISRTLRRARRLSIRLLSPRRVTAVLREKRAARAANAQLRATPVTQVARDDSLMAPVPIAHHVSRYAQQLRGVSKRPEAS
jgi:hypothetical protein